jgi:hypothetical protein
LCIVFETEDTAQVNRSFARQVKAWVGGGMKLLQFYPILYAALVEASAEFDTTVVLALKQGTPLAVGHVHRPQSPF